MLTDADLAYMRGVVTDLLPDTCTILSESVAQDGQGGVTSTWGTVATRVACRLDDKAIASNQIASVGGGLKASHQYQLSLSHDVSLSAGNRVEINSVLYTVIGVNVNQSWLVGKRAVLESI